MTIDQIRNERKKLELEQAQIGSTWTSIVEISSHFNFSATSEARSKTGRHSSSEDSSEKLREQILENITPLLSKALDCEVRYLNMAFELIWSISTKK
jgi:hypothetical protein